LINTELRNDVQEKALPVVMDF